MLIFTIIDYTTNPVGDEVIVDEPVGWDGLAMRLKRDKTWHGFFDFFDDSLNTSLQWHGEAADVLSSAYEAKGVQANVKLLIEYKCSHLDDFQTIYTGNFNFAVKYIHVKGDYCYVESGLDATSCLITFKSRYNQKVDINATTSFDGETELAPYDAINSDVSIGGKVIFYESDGASIEAVNVNAIQNIANVTYPTGYLPDGIGGYRTGLRNGYFTMFTNVTKRELTTFDGGINEYVEGTINSSSEPSFIFKLEAPPLCSSYRVRIRISFSGTFNSASGASRDEFLTFNVRKGFNAYSGFTTIDTAVLGTYTGTSNYNNPFTYSLDTEVDIQAGENLYIYFFYSCTKFDNQPHDPVVEFNNDYNVNLSSNSRCKTSVVKASFINESLSRVAEIITDDCLRVKSDYFGRTDSQPYTSDSNGCGSMETITNGLKVRGADGSDGNPAKMYTSFQALFDGLNAIHNIGICVEPDTERGSGYEWLRVEKLDYFYNNTVVLEMDGVRELRKEIKTDLLYSLINIGYQKWETESVNGLNDVFSQREYRSTLSNIKNTLDRFSAFIASDYALEVTRRQFGGTSKDWRYDNETFIICVTDELYVNEVAVGSFVKFIQSDGYDGYGMVLAGQNYDISDGDIIDLSGTSANDGTYTVYKVQFGPFNTTYVFLVETVVETGMGPSESFTITQNSLSPNTLRAERDIVSSSSNILYPETCYNLRITPVRNLLRHLKLAFMAYRDYLTNQLEFTSGTGNFNAVIDLNVVNCLLESGALAENGAISTSTLTSGTDAKPLFYPEYDRCTYPMSWDDYLAVKANPYGLIKYRVSGTWNYGWLDDLKYNPGTGEAEFIIKPKYN